MFHSRNVNFCSNLEYSLAQYSHLYSPLRAFTYLCSKTILYNLFSKKITHFYDSFSSITQKVNDFGQCGHGIASEANLVLGGFQSSITRKGCSSTSISIFCDIVMIFRDLDKIFQKIRKFWQIDELKF